MNPGQQFCLRWNNYQSTLQHVFHDLWVSGTFVDVSLVVEGRRIDCHKVVLSACSSYFEQILRDHGSNHPHPLILLHDVPFSAVEALVIFMYQGEVNVGQEELAALLRVAESLRVKGLADSATVSNFNKRRMLERCVPLLERASHNNPIVERPPHNPAVASKGALTVPTTSINHPRMTSRGVGGFVNLSKHCSGVLRNLSNGVVRKPEGQVGLRVTSPGPRKKRPRSEEPIDTVASCYSSSPSLPSLSCSTSSSLPPTPPASLNDTPSMETSQPSPEHTSTPTELIKQDPADETDGELQIDESADQSPVEPPDRDPSPTVPQTVWPNSPKSGRPKLLQMLGQGEEIKIETHEVEVEEPRPPTPQTLLRLPDLHPAAPPSTQSTPATLDHVPQIQLPQGALSEGVQTATLGKERPGNIGGKSCERTYTHLDLEEGIEAVLLGHLTPAKAIAQYKIPRRTFFRRLSAVRKSRGIPSAKENAADHFLTNSTSPGETESSLGHPGSDSESYAASFKIKSERPVLIAPKEEKNKANKGDVNGVMASNNYFSLLNLAANNKYDAYFNYLKMVAQQGDNSATPEEVMEALKKSSDIEGKQAIDDNRNVSDSALALVTNNASAE